MARFRYSGINWEPRAWRASDGIRSLGQQIEALYPDGEPTDGTVASKAHDAASPASDHRPYPYSGPGIVRAIDIGGGEEVDDLVEQLRLSRDPRIRYVIRYGRIFTSYPVGSRPAWQWGPYSGENPHNTHAHVSVLPLADNDGRLWEIGDTMPLSNADIDAIRDAVWLDATIPDLDNVGSRTHMSDAVKEAWADAKAAAADARLARIDAAVARRLLEEGAAGTVSLSPADIERIADEVRNEFAERPLS